MRDDTSHCLDAGCECSEFVWAQSFAAGVAVERARVVELINQALTENRRDWQDHGAALRSVLRDLQAKLVAP